MSSKKKLTTAAVPDTAAPFVAALAALALLVSASCEASGDPGEGLHLDDLTPLGYTEEVRVGSLDDPDEGFSRIGGVELADDGTVYVLESQVPEIRVYDAGGRRLRTVGGPGEGPGEFRFPAIFGLIGDTLWVNDRGTQRVSWFGPDGSLVRETRMTRLPVETDVPGMLLSVGPSAPRPDGLLGSGYTIMMSGGAADRPYAFPVVRFDRDGGVVDTLRWDTVHPPPTVRVGDRQLFPPSIRPVSPMTETVGDHRVEIRWSVPPGDGDGRLDVVRITSGGDTLHRSRLRYEPVPLPGSAADSLLEGRTAGADRFGVSEREMAAALRAGLELPEHRPPLRSSHVGRDGSVWMELNGASPDSVDWAVLEPDGTPRGRVILPIGMEPRASDGPVVWAVQLDELEVPWLVRLRLEPS